MSERRIGINRRGDAYEWSVMELEYVGPNRIPVFTEITGGTAPSIKTAELAASEVA